MTGTNIMRKKDYGLIVSTRLPSNMKTELEKKHPNKGEVSKLLRILVDKYLKGRIIGVNLEL